VSRSGREAPRGYDAVEELGRLGDARAVDLLSSTLQESDAVLQAKTAQSLGAIGDRRAVPALIRLLGRRQGQPNHKLCDYAAQALISLGEEETVSAFADAFADALEGRLEARTNLPRPAPALEPRADTLPKPADGAALPTTGILPKATDL
jgi:HEAT repeat protein